MPGAPQTVSGEAVVTLRSGWFRVLTYSHRSVPYAEELEHWTQCLAQNKHSMRVNFSGCCCHSFIQAGTGPDLGVPE